MYQSSSIYTPQISISAVFILRRMSWALGKPMTKTLNHTILGLVPKLNHEVICGACLDRRCAACPITFSQNLAADSGRGTYSV
ncbi:MAG: hypothetical protein PF693_00180 [Spirochaetia bacterium]|jgi:hypothetical protein|nr:hypothetical protein [Spirochaetia bacterium]